MLVYQKLWFLATTLLLLLVKQHLPTEKKTHRILKIFEVNSLSKLE